MYEAKVTLGFSAAHYLVNYPGNCARLHGHNWKVIVTVSSEKLNELGFVIDFKDLKSKTKKIIDELDHTLINDHPDFKNVNPSSENIACWIYNRLKEELKEEKCTLFSVEVKETETSSIIYYGPKI